MAFGSYQRQRGGLLIPIRDVTGTVATHQLKPDTPRTDETGRVIKYETAAHGRICIDVPAASLPLLRDAGVPLWITEGPKTPADSRETAHFCTFRSTCSTEQRCGVFPATMRILVQQNPNKTTTAGARCLMISINSRAGVGKRGRHRK
ncbi:MAG TPA: hypothetical protein VGW38_17075 [Chloroflexota bacterium]|nr:hypothetical protein [Chloroflexota bacterium]